VTTAAAGADDLKADGPPPGGAVASRGAIWALACIAPALTFVGTSIPHYYQTDFWHHLARGRAIVQSGELVNEDRFTYTVAGQPLRDPNWLSQIVYYGLYELGGLALVRTVNSLTLAAAVGVLVFLCHRASGSLFLATLLGIWTFLGLMQLFIVRPQTFSFLLFALLLTSLELSEQRRPWLLAAPVLLALWVNMHGGFPIGFILIGAFVLIAFWNALRSRGWEALRDRRLRDLVICLVAAVLATGINPYGFGIYRYVGTTTTSAAARGIQEWLPPGLELFAGQVWAASILLLLVAFSLSVRRPTAHDYCLVFVFLPPTFGAIRMLAWWYLVSMPVVAAQFGPLLARIRWPASEARPSPLIGALSLAMVGLAVVVSVPGIHERLAAEAEPVESATEIDLEEVAEHLRAVHSQGNRIFCRFEWGEYLSWALEPAGYRIFADGRIEIIPDNIWVDYLAVTQGRGDWQKILDKYGVTILVLDDDPDSHDPLIPLVRGSGQWVEVYRADGVRRPVHRPVPVVFFKKKPLAKPGDSRQTREPQRPPARRSPASNS
jgi:hypothetical protein